MAVAGEFDPSHVVGRCCECVSVSTQSQQIEQQVGEAIKLD